MRGKAESLFLMVISMLMLVLGTILAMEYKDYFLLATSGIVLALASMYQTEYEIQKLRKKILPLLKEQNQVTEKAINLMEKWKNEA